MGKRYFRVEGYFDSATKLQAATVIIDDGARLLSLRIRGRRDQLTVPWVPELEKLYQREQTAKAVAIKPVRRRRLTSRGLLTVGR